MTNMLCESGIESSTFTVGTNDIEVTSLVVDKLSKPVVTMPELVDCVDAFPVEGAYGPRPSLLTVIVEMGRSLGFKLDTDEETDQFLERVFDVNLAPDKHPMDFDVTVNEDSCPEPQVSYARLITTKAERQAKKRQRQAKRRNRR